MQTVSVPYGRAALEFNLDARYLKAVLTPAHDAADARANDPEAQRALVREALRHPIESAPLCELARGKKRVLVIVSDHTRPVPSALTLPLYLEEIRSGAPEAEIRILVATGMHRKTTEAEMREKFGEALVNRERFFCHAATEESEMTFRGILPSGGELWLNKLADWSELTVSEGFIEPHFFAGFSGGRKSILPGIASAKTVLFNHNAEFLKSPHAVQGTLEGNPIHRDMRYAAQKAGLRFILNVLLDGQKRVIAAYAGDPEAAHAAGCADCLARTRVPQTPADIVITGNGGYPLDQNVYQSVKGMTAAEACVRTGGVIVMCAALGDGHGGERFYRWFAESDGPRTVRDRIESIPAGETLPDQWEAQMLARVMLKATVVFVTGVENRTLIERMHMRWAETPESALDLARALTRPDADVAVIPDGVGVIVRRCM